MSKSNICVYPSQCQFPRCNCDQPHKAEKHQPRYPHTGVWPYISPEKGGVAGRAYNPNPFDNRYKEFGNAFTKQFDDLNEQVEDRAKAFADSTDNRNADGLNRHGCSYTDCGCDKSCTTPQVSRERFVVYVDVGNLPAPKAKEYLDNVQKTFFESYPAEKSPDITWMFIATRNGNTKVERLS
jgi:hypothetical protein